MAKWIFLGCMLLVQFIHSKPVVKEWTGTASFYHTKFEGRKTANGEVFSNKKMTAANNFLPLGTKVKVTNLKNKKSVIVKINDRLHPKNKRLIDLTLAAAKKLNFTAQGLCRVKMQLVDKNNVEDDTEE